jgi:alpha-L-fucosidase
MSKVTYKSTSPYASTPTFGPFMDVLTYRPITKKDSDVTYTIDTVYAYRPDMLAYDLYGDSGLWWVFAIRNPNTITDPVFGFTAGTVIYIPTKETLTADLGL